MLAVGLEPLDDGAPLLRGRGARDGERLEVAQTINGGGHAPFLGELRKHQRFVALRREALDPVADVVHLARLPGRGVGVAYLLEPHNERENMRDADFRAERPQIHDAFPFGSLVIAALRGAQFDGVHRDEFLGQIVQNLALLPAQLQFRVTPHQRGAGRVALRLSRGIVVNELEDRGQLVLLILDRRAGQRPRPRSREPLQRDARFVAILDPLRLVGDDHVPRPPSRGAAEVRPQRLVADERDVTPRLPPRRAVGRRPANDDRREFRRPLFDLAPPLVEQTGRRDHEAGRNLLLRLEDARRRNRLQRLAQPHIVREQQPLAFDERVHALHLEGHQDSGPVEADAPIGAGVFQRSGERRPEPLRKRQPARVGAPLRQRVG